MPTPAHLLTERVEDLRTPVVVAARRTPVATAGRALARHDVTALAAPVLRALVGDLSVSSTGPTPVEHVVLGNCMGPGGDPARVAALAAGLGTQVPGLTVDRQCGSGLEAIGLAAHLVVAGTRVALAGGVESASTAPTRLALQPDGSRRPYDRARFAPDELGDPGMGEAADALAAGAGVSRARQDAYAVRSHELTLRARSEGAFDAELVPVGDVRADDRPRRLDVAQLARFRPAFGAHGTATAGNSCGISDGAAGVAVVDQATRTEYGLSGIAVRAVAAVGVDPRLPGWGPVPAVRAVLAAAGLEVADIGAFEITEAFAGQVLACTDAWGLDPVADHDGRVCGEGGAIAIGHPWGASGAILLVRLFSRMVRRAGPRYGVATCAVGGGQGVAMLVERVG